MAIAILFLLLPISVKAVRSSLGDSRSVRRHYNCDEICSHSGGDSACVTSCEMEMYKCQGGVMVPGSAQVVATENACEQQVQSKYAPSYQPPPEDQKEHSSSIQRPSDREGNGKAEEPPLIHHLGAGADDAVREMREGASSAPSKVRAGTNGIVHSVGAGADETVDKATRNVRKTGDAVVHAAGPGTDTAVREAPHEVAICILAIIVFVLLAWYLFFLPKKSRRDTQYFEAEAEEADYISADEAATGLGADAAKQKPKQRPKSKTKSKSPRSDA